MKAVKNKINPCPFCGSTDLTTNLWSLNNGEVDAIECNNCNGAAPLTNWNKRHATNRCIQQPNKNRAA